MKRNGSIETDESFAQIRDFLFKVVGLIKMEAYVVRGDCRRK